LLIQGFCVKLKLQKPMAEFCSCGAQLVEDAVFCHKCGKPQRPIGAVEPEALPEPTPAVQALPAMPRPMPLGFQNAVAVRIAFSVAMIAALLSWVPLLPILLWPAAGYFAVLFYRRRTGALLSVQGGVRLGWITGVINFAITSLINVVPGVLSGGLRERFQAQVKSASDPNVQQALAKMLETGTGLASLILVVVFLLFIFITGLSMAGGALGAKLAGRSS
jgi:hypothetical protein